MRQQSKLRLKRVLLNDWEDGAGARRSSHRQASATLESTRRDGTLSATARSFLVRWKSSRGQLFPRVTTSQPGRCAFIYSLNVTSRAVLWLPGPPAAPVDLSAVRSSWDLRGRCCMSIPSALLVEVLFSRHNSLVRLSAECRRRRTTYCGSISVK